VDAVADALNTSTLNCARVGTRIYHEFVTSKSSPGDSPAPKQWLDVTRHAMPMSTRWPLVVIQHHVFSDDRVQTGLETSNVVGHCLMMYIEQIG
jgi:hypothetical protein